MKFQDEPVKTVYRHWICSENYCRGEMRIMRGGVGVITADGKSTFPHECNVCMRQEWGEEHPRLVHLAVEASEETREVS